MPKDKVEEPHNPVLDKDPSFLDQLFTPVVKKWCKIAGVLIVGAMVSCTFSNREIVQEEVVKAYDTTVVTVEELATTTVKALTPVPSAVETPSSDPLNNSDCDATVAVMLVSLIDQIPYDKEKMKLDLLLNCGT